MENFIKIENFRLYNPEGFPNEVLALLPLISVDIDMPALYKGKLHIEQITINLSEFVAIKNKEGELNVNSLKVMKEHGDTDEKLQEEVEKEKKKEKEKPKAKKEEKSSEEAQIDKVTLSIGKVIYKDYSKGGEPSVKTFEINLKNKEYEGIPDVKSLIITIVIQTLMRTTINGAIKLGTTSALIGGTAASGGALLAVGVVMKMAKHGGMDTEFDNDYKEVFDAGMKTASEVGTVSESDEEFGQIMGSAGKTNFTIDVRKLENGKVSILVGAENEAGAIDPKTAKHITEEINKKLKKDTKGKSKKDRKGDKKKDTKEKAKKDTKEEIKGEAKEEPKKETKVKDKIKEKVTGKTKEDTKEGVMEETLEKAKETVKE